MLQKLRNGVVPPAGAEGAAYEELEEEEEKLELDLESSAAKMQPMTESQAVAAGAAIVDAFGEVDVAQSDNGAGVGSNTTLATEKEKGSKFAEVVRNAMQVQVAQNVRNALQEQAMQNDETLQKEGSKKGKGVNSKRSKFQGAYENVRN